MISHQRRSLKMNSILSESPLTFIVERKTIDGRSDVYSPKKFDFKYLQATNGLWQTNREEGKVHRATQEKRKEQQRDSV